MGFQYLHIHAKADKLTATVTDHGPSLGGPNSRNSSSPVAVFQIESFSGLENISDDDLIQEILTRFTVAQLMHRLDWKLSNGTLLEMIRERLLK
jgi:hypothetical protein